MPRKYAFLTHKYNNFSKHNILKTLDEYRFSSPGALESHLWVYELCSQIQQRTGSSCVLKGGACGQLYLPLNLQRCTQDIDIATNLSPGDLYDLLNSITNEFNRHQFFSSFREYIPRFASPDELIPMKTFLFTLPFIYKKGKNNDYADIKMDFLFSNPDSLPYQTLDNGETLGLKLNYTPVCLTPYSMISSKIITFASSYIGIPAHKSESFYKNIYDLYYLINEYNDLDSFKRVASLLKENIAVELDMKTLPFIETKVILKDILRQLYAISTLDLLTSIPRSLPKVRTFEERNLQGNVRADLNPDIWAVMAMYLFIWTFSLCRYIEEGTFDDLNVINMVVEDYENYIVTDKHIRRKIIKNYKSSISDYDERLVLSRGFDPLRIIYLYHLLSQLKPDVKVIFARHQQ